MDTSQTHSSLPATALLCLPFPFTVHTHAQNISSISSALERVQCRLYILLQGETVPREWSRVQGVLHRYYDTAARHAPFVDVLVLLSSVRGPDDLLDVAETFPWDSYDSVSCNDTLRDLYEADLAEQTPEERHYDRSACGGAFDHLHAGHKLLLTAAALVTTVELTVGVSDDALLTEKAFRGHVQPLATRCDRVAEFLRIFKPNLAQNIVPICDVFGPTATDPALQALIVSKETIAGAESIRIKREERSLCALDVVVIDLVGVGRKGEKLSSTWYRRQLS